MAILEDLWYGRIDPSEQYLQKDREYFEMRHRISAEEERLVSGLSPETRQIFDQVMDLHKDLDIITEKKAFMTGFRLGVQFLVESL